MSQFDIVFNTISIFIVDLSLFEWSVVSREAELRKVLRTVDAVLVVQELHEMLMVYLG